MVNGWYWERKSIAGWWPFNLVVGAMVMEFTFGRQVASISPWFCTEKGLQQQLAEVNSGSSILGEMGAQAPPTNVQEGEEGWLRELPILILQSPRYEVEFRTKYFNSTVILLFVVLSAYLDGQIAIIYLLYQTFHPWHRVTSSMWTRSNAETFTTFYSKVLL